MKLPRELAQSIVWDDAEGWETIESNVVDTTRWSVVSEGVFKNTIDGKFYQVCWLEAATECQSEVPFEYEDQVLFTEVYQVEKVQLVWENVTTKGNK